MKKIFKGGALSFATFSSFTGTLVCSIINYATDISPITGVWFSLYMFTVFIVSLYISFTTIQYLLLLNKPLKYDFEKFGGDYPYLAFVSKMCPTLPQIDKSLGNREYDTNELSVISTVLERKLVSSWYVPYISQEIGFPFACKQRLDEMIGKAFQICNKIETRDVFVDTCTILSCHWREYQKAQLRNEQSPTTPIESLYKKSHPIFDLNNKKLQPADHCTKIIRIILKELVPWEMWDTPHSELIVRILAKKLDQFIDGTLSNPAWLNYQLLSLIKDKVETQDQQPQKETDIKNTNENSSQEKEEEKSPEDITLQPEAPVETVAPAPTVTKTSPTLPKKVLEEVKEEPTAESIECIVEEVPVTSTEPVDIKSSPVLRQRRGRQGRNEVKIYDRIIEGSVKTWETDMDLQCISLGQDLLASLDGEMALSRLWAPDAEPEPSPRPHHHPPRAKSPQPLWFGEEESVELEAAVPGGEARRELSPKPGELLKDLQSTVSHAKKHIGDLQVHTQAHSDEAAGMMEGLLDFGIAGLKKGLRFTGLSDDSDKSPSHQRDRSSDKTPPEPARGKQEPDNVARATDGVAESGAHPLVKQHRVISQDSVPSQPQAIPRAESPEPEYEEAEDLSTSIAKLRCLLEQRASSPGVRSEEAWWGGAGGAHAHVDTATLADEYDMSLERSASPSNAPNNMQRLDKLFQRTVTGVFNSLKTAVGAEQAPARAALNWTYVCTSVDHGVCGAVGRLLGARRAHAHVDAALDSLAHAHAHAHLQAHPSPTEPTDFEEWCAVRGACACALGGALQAARAARAHASLRLAHVLAGDLAETLIELYLEVVTCWLRSEVFHVFSAMAQREGGAEDKVPYPDVDIDDTCHAVFNKIPSSVKFVFGEETLSESVRLVVSSFSHQEINRDVAFRMLDLLAGHFKRTAALWDPSFDNN